MAKTLKNKALARKSVRSGRNGRTASIDSILKALRITYQSVQAHSQQIEKTCGVSAAQLAAMWELHETPGMSVSELANALLIHRSTSSNMLDKLEKKNLIRRERVGLDQRVVQLYLTAAGQALLIDAPRPAQGVLSDALQQLPNTVLHCLSSDLSKLITLLKVRDEQMTSVTPAPTSMKRGAAARL